MPAKFSLAKTLDYLLSEKEYSPELKAMLAIPVLGLIVWFMASDKRPTPEEDAADARHYYSKAVVRRKYLNARGAPVLSISQGTLLAEEIDWGKSFFSLESANDGFPINSRKAYLRTQRYSLVTYAVAGDSLLKKSGGLSAIVKRGQQTRVFYFHSLWE
jgi:hypothetical protein